MTGYDMALALWREEHGREPKASDAAFLELVARCVRALQGHGVPWGSTRPVEGLT